MSHDQTVTLARPTTAEVEREERSASKGRWKIVVDGHESEMTYSRASPQLIIIDHTAVDDALRGRVTVPASADEETVRAAALADPHVQKFVENRPVRKFIFRPQNKLANVVV